MGLKQSFCSRYFHWNIWYCSTKLVQVLSLSLHPSVLLVVPFSVWAQTWQKHQRAVVLLHFLKTKLWSHFRIRFPSCPMLQSILMWTKIIVTFFRKSHKNKGKYFGQKRQSGGNKFNSRKNREEIQSQRKSKKTDNVHVFHGHFPCVWWISGNFFPIFPLICHT